MAKRGYHHRSRGNYKFTPKRRAQLKRAAEISARKRRRHNIKRNAAVAGGVAATLGAAYWAAGPGGRQKGKDAVSNLRTFPTRNKAKIAAFGTAVSSPSNVAASVRGMKPKIANSRNRLAARLAVQPGAKEATRVMVAEKLDDPTKVQIEEIRQKANARVGDNRIYDEDDNIDSEAMVNRSVGATNRSKAAKDARRAESSKRRRLKQARKKRAEVLGKPEESLSGTPGGGITPPKARKPREEIDPIEGLKLHNADASLRILNGTRVAGWDSMTADSRAITSAQLGVFGYGVGPKAGWIFTEKWVKAK